MECALLFEVGWQRLVDRTVLVFCPEEERLRRVMTRDDIDRATALPLDRSANAGRRKNRKWPM